MRLRYLRKQHNFQRISCNFHHAHQRPGILCGRWSRGHGENSNMDWRKEHTSTSTFTLLIICTMSLYFIRCYILFYRYGKTSLSVFLLASTLGRGQPDSISSRPIHSYKSLPSRVNLTLIQIIIFLSHNFCVSRKLYVNISFSIKQFLIQFSPLCNLNVNFTFNRAWNRCPVTETYCSFMQQQK